ncbi:GYDIA family GHMP kinase [Tamlana flava]|uniref:GYDIA family GHMP kinase n=1 Tax=Tamlana flava TaxID=3158572 RepID=UPI00351AC84B
MKTFYSHGKLLLTGEYVVLDGAMSLAVPTKYGQSLTVENLDQPKIIWQSLDEKGKVWFEGEFQLNEISTSHATLNDVSKKLIQILDAAKTLNPEFLINSIGCKITTRLDFPRNWGLGTSSTLINNVAQWANVDAYQLLEKTFGGSGYDIACAQKDYAITYQIINSKPIVNTAEFNTSFKDCLYFIHLNRKQNSREGIKHYHSNKVNASNIINEINVITAKIISAKTLEEFDALIASHETLIAEITNQKTIKELLFEDFNGGLKSLGAWGGDFVLATSKSDPTSYFKVKGFETVIPYTSMIL